MPQRPGHGLNPFLGRFLFRQSLTAHCGPDHLGHRVKPDYPLCLVNQTSLFGDQAQDGGLGLHLIPARQVGHAKMRGRNHE